MGPLSFIVCNHTDQIIGNIPAYKKRLRNHRLPWAHIDNESKYNSLKQINPTELKDINLKEGGQTRKNTSDPQGSANQTPLKFAP